MPSKPHSAHDASMREAMLMNSEVVVTASLLSNTRTSPNFSTTNQRLASPGTCCREMGCFWNVSFGNARCVAMVALPVARSGAMQVVLLGRASTPLTLGGGGGGAACAGAGGAGAGAGAGAGGGAGGAADCGGFCEPPSPPEQPAI